MKFKFDIECTPEEARQFVGLPSVAGIAYAPRGQEELPGYKKDLFLHLRW